MGCTKCKCPIRKARKGLMFHRIEASEGEFYLAKICSDHDCMEPTSL